MNTLQGIKGFLKTTKLIYVKSTPESGDVTSFYFRPIKKVNFIAGQHGVFTLPKHKGTHIFSLSSAPSEDLIRISTHVREGSKYKQFLKNMNPGEVISLRGPVLFFTLDETATKHVFLAQGIGITPFRSMLIDAQTWQPRPDITLIHVDSHEHVFKTETQSLASMSYYPDSNETFTEFIQSLPLGQDTQYYLSGSPAFVKSTKQLLLRRSIAKKRIKADSFLGY